MAGVDLRYICKIENATVNGFGENGTNQQCEQGTEKASRRTTPNIIKSMHLGKPKSFPILELLKGDLQSSTWSFFIKKYLAYSRAARNGIVRTGKTIPTIIMRCPIVG